MHTASGNNYSASYTYDGRGNLTEKTVNNVTTDYSYTNDRLTSVNNTPLTYDSIGNVLTYGDKSYAWSSGRNLASITDGTNSYTYAYNKYGYRTSKTVNGVTTDFNVAEDGTIVSQSDGTNTLFFEYAEDGTPLGFVLNDTQYLYITNNSADVMALSDSTGNILATYSYNEWGKVTINATGDNLTFANLNPLRYRGYYYDTETEYYYLQSRYYDPSICRFINADLPEYASEQKDETAGVNIYVYCCNDSVNNCDYEGLKKKRPTIKLLMIFQEVERNCAEIGMLYVRKLYLEQHYDVVYYFVSVSNDKQFIDTWNQYSADIVLIFVHGYSNGQYALNRYYDSQVPINEYIHNNIHYKSLTKLVFNISCHGGIDKNTCSASILCDKIKGVVFSSNSIITAHAIFPFMLERKYKMKWTYHKYNYDKKVINYTKLKLKKLASMKYFINDARNRWNLKI